eukprot:3745213-Ditylum_brightwellii.AAC.1
MAQRRSCRGEHRMGLHFEERLKRMSSPQMRVKWKGRCWQILEISDALSVKPMAGGRLNVSTLAWRLRVFPPSVARDLFLQQSSPAHQDIPPILDAGRA